MGGAPRGRGLACGGVHEGHGRMFSASEECVVLKRNLARGLTPRALAARVPSVWRDACRSNFTSPPLPEGRWACEK
eukprot:4980140-Prymnesium_polylepis.1